MKNLRNIFVFMILLFCFASCSKSNAQAFDIDGEDPLNLKKINVTVQEAATTISELEYPSDIDGYHVIVTGNFEENGSEWENICKAVEEATYIYLDLSGTKGLKKIGGYVFPNSELEGIILPKSLTEIDKEAFADCTYLSVIKIPNSVTEIGEDAFFNCKSLESITLPNSVTKIGKSAFLSCKCLKSITIPNSVTKIDDYAFDGCESLENITIPKGVTEIGKGAFKDTALKNIEVDSKNSHFTSKDGILYSKDMTKLICYPAGKTNTEFSISNSVIEIGNYAFSDCESLASITIPDSVTTIGDYTFQYCNSLEDIEIPDSVTKIGPMAFYSCKSLKHITIPDSVEEIGIGENNRGDIQSPFYGLDSLESAIIPSHFELTTYFLRDLFYHCPNLHIIYYDGSIYSYNRY